MYVGASTQLNRVFGHITRLFLASTFKMFVGFNVDGVAVFQAYFNCCMLSSSHIR